MCDTAAVQANPKVAVVGHVEWVTFARVDHIPAAGEIVHAEEPFEEPAGGGGVAAVQLARLAGGAILVTALGSDEHGRRSVERLAELGVEVWAAQRPEPTRTATTLVDGNRERTITTYGTRLEAIGADREIPWEKLAQMDAVYFTAGDAVAMQAARSAGVLVSSPRALHALGHGIPLDALVLSSDDAEERQEASLAEQDAKLVVFTNGGHGGSYRGRDGDSGTWPAAELPGAPCDSYGCGDSFAAGLTYGLGTGLEVSEALALAARCGAFCLTGRGPYERQLCAADLKPASGE
ncbi:MAG TPA: PfkB family carbohydrate kinase [Solirubrobacteraceae bacterium]|nr:PfkB family carbohydrate kinase [Solirubrobacteraceae bacterium]